ncbi:hypothetical protein ACFSUS_23130 [Spirosoma soli]|uniref:DUF4398 domain-containing protein n=1 Tax=Spirosoma soli TaxID=1770529 RepID=A0ABW5M964_9BACT
MRLHLSIITAIIFLAFICHASFSQGYRAGTINNTWKPTPTPIPKPVNKTTGPGYTGYPVVQGDGGESKMAEQYVKAALAYEEAARKTKCTENRIVYSAQAEYHRCLADQLRIGSTAQCPKPTQQLIYCAADDQQSSAISEGQEVESNPSTQQIRERFTSTNDPISRTLYEQQMQLGTAIKDPTQQRDYYNTISKQQAESQAINQGVEAVGGLILNLFEAKRQRQAQEREQAERRAAYEERMAEKREAARQAEEERLEEERRRLALIRQKRDYILSPAKEKQLPSAQIDSQTRVLYYLPYAVLDETHIWLAAEPFAITRYTDGSWPLLRDIETQIHRALQKDYNVSGVPLLLSGYYTRLEEAQMARTEITIRSLNETGFLMHSFMFGSTAAEARSSTSTDFWGEKKAPSNQLQPLQQPKSKASFWDN